MRRNRLLLAGAAVLTIAAGAWLYGVDLADLAAGLAALPFLLPFVAIEVPSAAAVAEKYVRVTSGRAQDYTAGIQRVDAGRFEAAAGAAADTYAQGVQQAIAEGRFASGITGSGQRWRRKAEQLGSQRFPTGVSAARDDMQAGITPYLQTLQGLQLEPRRPRGDPANLGRVSAIAQALNQRRRQRA